MILLIWTSWALSGIIATQYLMFDVHVGLNLNNFIIRCILGMVLGYAIVIIAMIETFERNASTIYIIKPKEHVK